MSTGSAALKELTDVAGPAPSTQHVLFISLLESLPICDNIKTVIPENIDEYSASCELEPHGTRQIRVNTHGHYEITFEKATPSGHHSSITENPSHTYIARDIHRAPHDFTFAEISQQSEQSISECIGIGFDGGNATPDFFYAFQNRLIFVEFCTNRSHRASTHRNEVNRKINKYRFALRSAREELDKRGRSDEIIEFYVICVTHNIVYTTIPGFSQNLVNDLLIRFMSINNAQHFHESGVPAGRYSREDYSKDELEIKNIFRAMDPWVPTAKYPIFTARSVRENHLDKDLINRYEHEIIKRAYEELCQDNCATYMEEPRPSVYSIKVEQTRFNYWNAGRLLCEELKLKDELLDGPLSQQEKMALKFNAEVDKLIEENLKTKPANFTHKSILQVPFFATEPAMPTTSVFYPDDFPSDRDHPRTIKSIKGSQHDVAQVWNKCIGAALDQPRRYFAESITEAKSHALNPTVDDDKNPDRGKYRRVKIRLSPSEVKTLAEDGVGAKSASKSNNYIKTAIENKNKTLSITMSTQYIEDALAFIGSKDSPMNISMEIGETYDLIQEAINESLKFHVDEQLVNFYSQCETVSTSDVFGRVMHMVTQVGMELAASLKHNVGGSEFIIKKLRDHAVFLLIHPTRSDSHIFVSFMCHKEDLVYDGSNPNMMPGIFRNCHESDDHYFTDFVSFNQSKIINLIKAFPMYGVMKAFWLEEHKIIPSIIDSSHGHWPDSLKMTFMSMLMLLHDKAQAEEVATTARHFLGKGFTFAPEWPAIHERVDSLPFAPKSPLTVFLIQKVLSAAWRITCTRGYKRVLTSDGKTEDVTFQGMFNYITGSEIHDVQSLINTYYLGYLKNKDENAEDNALNKLITKIIEAEEKLPRKQDGRPDPKYLGEEDPEHLSDLKFLEFSPSVLTEMMNNAEKLLSKTLGETWRENLERKILASLAKLDLEEFATLKATSNFGIEHYNLEDALSRPYKRSKVIFKVIEQMKKNPTATSVMDLVHHALEVMESRGHMLIDLFKKNQHGGLREIYVLDICDRIVQKVVETISRTICSEFPSELMTHPTVKMELARRHEMNAKKTFKFGHVSFSDNKDAKKWNQGHITTKFCIMLKRFTPTYMHDFLTRSLQLWTNKRMMVPQRLLKIMSENAHIKSYDSVFDKMLQVHRGSIQVPWYERNTSYITVCSGMMQGILHYTSSLFHTIAQEFYKKKITQWSLKELKNPCHVSVGQSSDDSLITVSFSCTSKEELAQSAIFCASAFRRCSLYGNAIGIYRSDKTVSMTIDQMEINSEWFIGGYLYRPALRWVAAVLNIIEESSIIGRQMNLQNLLRSLPEGGTTTLTTAICQRQQAFLHYTLLGVGVSSVGDELCKILIQNKDPSCGFFLMDHPFAPGMLGYKYNEWNLINHCSDMRKTAKDRLSKACLEKQEEKPVSREDYLETVGAGTIYTPIYLNLGHRKKWKQLLEEAGLPEDWMQIINNDPRILYSFSSTPVESMVKICLKLHSPGVAESLSRFGHVTRMAAAATFQAGFCCLTPVSSWYTAREVKGRKISLLYAATYVRSCQEESTSDLTEQEVHCLFPLCDQYEQVKEQLDSIELDLAPVTRKRRKNKTIVTVFTGTENKAIKLMDLVKFIWFEDNQRSHSQEIMEERWKAMKRMIPWLRDNHNDTLQASPFTGATQLYNFIVTYEEKTVSLKLTGVACKVRMGHTVLTTALCENFHTSYILKVKTDERKRVTALGISELTRKLAMLTLLPLSQESMNDNMRAILADPDTPQVPFAVENTTRRRQSLSILQMYARGESRESIIRCIDEMDRGMFGYFRTRQVSRVVDGRVIYQGEGVWVGKFDNSRVMIELNRTDGTYIDCIKVENENGIRNVQRMFLGFCRAFGFTHDRHPKACTPHGSAGSLVGGKRFENNKGAGIPVVVMNLNFALEPSRFKGMRLEVHRNLVRLTAPVGYGQHKYATLVTFSCDQSDLSVPSTYDLERGLEKYDDPELDIVDRWLFHVPVPPSWLTALALGTIDGYDKVQAQSFARKQIWSSLARKGVRSTVTMSPGRLSSSCTSESGSALELDHARWVGYNTGIQLPEFVYDEADRFKRTTIFGTEGDLVDAFTFIKTMFQDSESHPVDRRLTYDYSPFADYYADELIEQIGQTPLENFLQQKTYTQDKKEQLEEFAKIMGMNFRNFTLVNPRSRDIGPIPSGAIGRRARGLIRRRSQSGESRSKRAKSQDDDVDMPPPPEPIAHSSSTSVPPPKHKEHTTPSRSPSSDSSGSKRRKEPSPPMEQRVEQKKRRETDDRQDPPDKL